MKSSTDKKEQQYSSCPQTIIISDSVISGNMSLDTVASVENPHFATSRLQICRKGVVK